MSCTCTISLASGDTTDDEVLLNWWFECYRKATLILQTELDRIFTENVNRITCKLSILVSLK